MVVDDIIKVVLSQTGLLGAAVIVFLYLLYTRRLVWGAELKAAEKRVEEARQDCAENIAKLERDRDSYRDFCLELARSHSKLAEATRAVVSG